MKLVRRIDARAASLITAMLGFGLMACSAGGGGTDVGRGNQNRAGSFEKPSGQQEGTPAPTPAPGAGDDDDDVNVPGNATAGCEGVCGEDFECEATANGEPVDLNVDDLSLGKESGGKCSASNGAVLTCDGTVTLGNDKGTWKKQGNRVTVTVKADAVTIQISCSKK